VARSIGRAFDAAYVQFLKANGVDVSEASHHQQQQQSSVVGDYQAVLNQQQISADELRLFANKRLQKEVSH